jgi:hypothetical protein
MRMGEAEEAGMTTKVRPITDELSDVPVERFDINRLSETSEALDAIATVLRYVGTAGQVGGDEGERAAWAAIGLASAVELAVARIEQFQVRQLEVRGGAK